MAIVAGADVRRYGQSNLAVNFVFSETSTMKKIISIAVGVAAATTVAGTALANNTQTVNSSEGYVAPEIATAFIPEFVSGDCTAALGYSTTTAGGTVAGDCNGHGTVAAANAAFGSGAYNISPTETTAGYFDNPDMMPILNLAVWTGGISSAAWKNAAPFSSGLMSWGMHGVMDRADGSSYFAGLTYGWTGYSDAAANPEVPMGAPIMAGGSESARDQWVDQTVVGYITSMKTAGSTNPADLNYIQNFRSQLSFETMDISHIDQRLEQDLGLNDGTSTGGNAGAAFEASRQTLQTAFAVNSDANGVNEGFISISGGAGGGPAGATIGNAANQGIGQLVTQDVEGWFYSCLNCDTTTPGVHAFTPTHVNLTFMPYTSGWNVAPSISHGVSGGNGPAPGTVFP